MTGAGDFSREPRLVPMGEKRSDSMSDRFAVLHRQLIEVAPAVDRLACVLFDADTGTLRTFADSSQSTTPIRCDAFSLATNRSLSELVRTRRAWVTDDAQTQTTGNTAHPSAIQVTGFRSSYTVPLFDGEAFQGFLFIDSRQPRVFTEDVIERVQVYVNLVRMLICYEITAARALAGSGRVFPESTGLHDLDAGRHPDRMARYALLIARHLAPEYGLANEFVEQIFVFAPLHDIGKIGIPAAILHKPQPLTQVERTVMASHVELGIELVEKLIGSFQLEQLAGIRVLRNIVAYHHELLDGSGYPQGLAGDAIPLEARIATVADIFDALSSRRNYKPAWTLGEAFAAIGRMSVAGKLDQACVRGLTENVDAIRAIMTQNAI